MVPTSPKAEDCRSRKRIPQAKLCCTCAKQCWQRNAAATLLGSRIAVRVRVARGLGTHPRSLAARPAAACGATSRTLAAPYFGSRGSRTPARPARGACCGLGGLGSAASTAAIRSCMSSSSSLSVWHKNWNEYHRTCPTCGPASARHVAPAQRVALARHVARRQLEQAARCMCHGARLPQRSSLNIVMHGFWSLADRGSSTSSPQVDGLQPITYSYMRHARAAPVSSTVSPAQRLAPP